MARTQKRKTEVRPKTTNRSGTKKSIKVREPIYVLFDLDETLIAVDWDVDRLAMLPDMPKELLVQNKFVNSAGQNVVQNAYLRPGVRDLLKNLPSHIKPGIWTGSFRNYSEGLATLLFGPDYKSRLACFISTDEYRDEQGNKVRVAYDILNDRRLPSRTVDKKVVKDLTLLFDRPEYGLTAQNTILIDDLDMQKRENPHRTRRNVITIPAWFPENHNTDRYLVTLARWLARLNNPVKDYRPPKFIAK